MPGEANKDQERLAKLWDAYEAQEKEYEATLKKISVYEAKIKEKDRINETLRKVVEARDSELRELEIKGTALEQSLARAEPKIDELSRQHKIEMERYAKLFAITEELEEDIAVARREIEARDEWYNRNISSLERLSDSIKERSMLIESARNLKNSAKAVNLDALKPSSDQIKFEHADMSATPSKEVKFETVAVSSPEDFLDSLLKIQGMDRTRAEALKKAGFDDLEKIKNATTRELAGVEGITPTLARKIKTELLGI
jgi:chromosome segregation ATPase